jgi:hypothetical protein
MGEVDLLKDPKRKYLTLAATIASSSETDSQMSISFVENVIADDDLVHCQRCFVYFKRLKPYKTKQIEAMVGTSSICLK